jgi:hypothetical protein
MTNWQTCCTSQLASLIDQFKEAFHFGNIENYRKEKQCFLDILLDIKFYLFYIVISPSYFHVSFENQGIKTWNIEIQIKRLLIFLSHIIHWLRMLVILLL